MSFPPPSGAAAWPDPPCEGTATITLLREYGAGAVHAAIITDCNLRGMQLRVPAAMQAGDPVRIDVGDSMLLGEVVQSSRESDSGDYSSWCIGIHFEQGIFGLKALERLLEAIGGRDRSSGFPRPSASGVQAAEPLHERVHECCSKQKEKGAANPACPIAPLETSLPNHLDHRSLPSK